MVYPTLAPVSSRRCTVRNTKIPMSSNSELDLMKGIRTAQVGENLVVQTTSFLVSNSLPLSIINPFHPTVVSHITHDPLTNRQPYSMMLVGSRLITRTDLSFYILGYLGSGIVGIGF